MLKLGLLRPCIGKPHIYYEGYIEVEGVRLALRLIRNHKAYNANSPAYYIHAVRSERMSETVGAVWFKSRTGKDNDLFEFWTLSLKETAFGKPLNLVAYALDDGSYEIRRRQRGAKIDVQEVS